MISFLWIGRAEGPILDWPPGAISRPRPHNPPVADRRPDATRAAASAATQCKTFPARPMTTVPASTIARTRGPAACSRRQSCCRRPPQCAALIASLLLDASLARRQDAKEAGESQDPVGGLSCGLPWLLAVGSGLGLLVVPPCMELADRQKGFRCLPKITPMSGAELDRGF